MRKVFHLPVLILLFAAAASQSQQTPLSSQKARRFVFDRIGVADGLSNQYVNCIVQDKYGFLWFGTKDGLCRYDGREFKTYKSISGDSTSLSGNEIQALFSDSRGMLWVGANGLQRYNFDRDNFMRITPPRYGVLANKLRFVSEICEDRFGALWLGTFGQGLFRFDPLTGQLAEVDLGSEAPSPFGGDLIYSLSSNGSDTIWIATSNHRLIALNSRTNKQNSYSLTQKGDIQHAFHDRTGRLWLAAIGEPLKRVHVRLNGEITFTRFENIRPDNFIFCFRDDRSGNLWMGTQQEGIYVLNPDKNETQNYRHKSNDPSSLPGDDIQELYEDRDGNMWIATDNGVAKRARWKKPFRHFTHDTESANSINSAEVTGIDQDENGDLWISTFNTGFCKFNPRTERFIRYDPSTCAIKSPWAMDIVADRRGFVWIATNFQHGLNRFDLSSGAFTEFLSNSKDTTSINSNLVTSLFEDHQGRIWIGPAFRGLNLYEPRINGFKRFKHDPSNPATLSSNNVLSIYEDGERTLWIGTSRGLNRLDPRQFSFVQYYPAAMVNHEAGSFEVFAMLEDSKHRFWLGTNLGLYLFDRQNGKFERYTEVPDLSDGRIFGIMDDADGNLWLQTTAAVAKFDPQSRRFRIYDRNDGWIQNVVNEQEWRNAYEKLDSGELVFGGANGMTIFHPDSIGDNPNVPPVHITGFRLFYESVEVGQSLEGRRARGDSLLTNSLLLTDHLTLKHSERTFSFEFAALDFTLPEANQYAFMLEGFHDDWVFCGNERTATFTNIPPGEYTFRVKGANNDGLWNEQGDAISISILPPWWRTTLAYLGYAVLLAALIYTARRFEMNRIRMRNQLRMSEFEAQKLHEVDQLKSRFFANISHEFRTPLTLILGPLEGVIAKVKDKAAKEDLRIMERSANRLLRLINQLLDLSRLESGRMTLHASRGDFIAFLKGIVMSFASLAEQKQITLKFESEPELENHAAGEIYFDRDKIEKIFYNLLSNAFKFTREGGKVSVQLSVNSNQLSAISDPFSVVSNDLLNTDHCLLITVRDTGIGISADRLPHVFDRFYQVDNSSTREHEGTGIGLALTKELVERHYGAITVRSEEGKGAEFIVCLPLGKEHLKPGEITEEVVSDQLSVSSWTASRKLQVASESDAIISSIQQSIDPTIQQPASNIKQNASSDRDIILVVDDHPDMRRFIRQHLELAYQILEAKDGREGVDAAFDAIPDLVISDVMMPRLDGYQLCAALKTDEQTSHIPVILLTAKAGEESKLAGLETGADDYLVKPFNARELQLRAHNLIAQRRKLRERFRREGLLQPREVVAPSAEEAFLQKLMGIVEANLADEDFGVESLSEALHIGRRQLLRKIRSLSGQSPVEFIRSVRLQRARQLLEQKAGSVSEVAYMVGFSNLSYFAKAFREEFNMLPSELVFKS